METVRLRLREENVRGDGNFACVAWRLCYLVGILSLEGLRDGALHRTFPTR
jgi:hypothetical protein